jgi:hypothetical protein
MRTDPSACKTRKNGARRNTLKSRRGHGPTRAIHAAPVTETMTVSPAVALARTPPGGGPTKSKLPRAFGTQLRSEQVVPGAQSKSAMHEAPAPPGS